MRHTGATLGGAEQPWPGQGRCVWLNIELTSILVIGFTDLFINQSLPGLPGAYPAPLATFIRQHEVLVIGDIPKSGLEHRFF